METGTWFHVNGMDFRVSDARAWKPLTLELQNSIAILIPILAYSSSSSKINNLQCINKFPYNGEKISEIVNPTFIDRFVSLLQNANYYVQGIKR